MKTPIADVLRTKGQEVFSITPEATVFEAVKEMSAHHIGSLLVLAADGKLMGIVSERDCRDVILQEKDPQTVKVSEALSKDLITVTPDRSLESCMQLMTEKRVRHLPVMKDEAVVGMISIGDLVKYLCTERGREIDNLEKYITGSM